MKIQINSDRNIVIHEGFAAELEQSISKTLSHFSRQITRVEVHLGDENGHKGGGQQDDKRCAMEARLQGRPPLAVTCNAPSLQQAAAGAAEKLNRLIESSLGRVDKDLREVPSSDDTTS
jgi:ribosome-associated translation inhibitor RaiA